LAHCACRMRHRFMLEFSVEPRKRRAPLASLWHAPGWRAFPAVVLNDHNCDDFLFFIRPWRAHTNNVVIRTDASRSSGLVIERGFLLYLCY
jgi:hypothetical protein